MLRSGRVPLVLKLLPLAAAALMVTVMVSGTGLEQVAAQQVSPDISISGPEGCNTNGSPPEDKCEAAAGTGFTIKGDLKTLGGLTGYASFDLWLSADGAVVNLADTPGQAEEVVGPECATNAEDNSGLPTKIGLSCTLAPFGPPMTFVGTVFEVAAECKRGGQGEIRMVLGGPLNSHVTDPSIFVVDDLNDKGVDEVLTINCEGPVGGSAELPAVASAPLEAEGSSGLGAGVVAGIVAAVQAGVLALGGAAWYARRRRSP